MEVAERGQAERSRPNGAKIEAPAVSQEDSPGGGSEGNKGESAQDRAIEILNAHRLMAISTLRPDGWPQTTIVGYANDGLAIYFLIFRSSQKLANIRHDRRVSFAVGGDEEDLAHATAVYAAAHAVELTDDEERAQGWRILVSRHPNLEDFELPGRTKAAMIMAKCRYVSVVDYRRDLGHVEQFSIGDEEGVEKHRTLTDTWGEVAVKPAMAGGRKQPAGAGDQAT